MERKSLMHQEIISKKWLSAKNYLLALAMLLGGQGNSFAQSPDLEDYNCKLFPAGTFFGGAYADTTGIKNPDDIAAFFAEYGINFEIGTLSNYQMGVSLDEYFDSVPDFGNTLKSNYLFYDIPDGSIYSLGFPAKAFSGKTYRYKMRVYVQAKKDCASSVSAALANAKVRMKTQHGSQDSDSFEVMAYDLQGNALKGSDNEVVDGKIKPVVIKSPNTGFSLSQVLNIDSVMPSDIICLDVCSYGVFPETAIGLENFKLTYELEQFECSKVAVEYLYTDYETYCISSTTACKGDSVKVHAAGFPRNSTYKWYKQNGADWELLENVSGTGDEYAKATIYVDYVGAVRYKVAVSNNSYFASTRELEFNIYGEDCHSFSFDCGSLADLDIVAECGKNSVTFDEIYIGLPVWNDATIPNGVSVYGVRSDGRKLEEEYFVGTTEIAWNFSIDNIDTIVCYQKINVVAPKCPIDVVYVSVVASDSTLGTTTGSNTYAVGDTAVIEAIPNKNAIFKMWSDGDTLSRRTIVCDSEKVYIAIFEKKIATDVDMVDAADVDPIVNVYSVDGALLKKNVKLSEALATLKRGYYIINNKKVYISK